MNPANYDYRVYTNGFNDMCCNDREAAKRHARARVHQGYRRVWIVGPDGKRVRKTEWAKESN